MKSALSAFFVFVLVHVCICTAGPVATSASTRTPVRFNLEVDAKRGLQHIADLLHITIKTDTVLSAPYISANAENLEARYAIAWFARLANATAKFENGWVVVRPMWAQPQGDVIFDCWMETNGAWRAALATAIDRPVTISLTNVSAATAIQMASRIEGLSVIRDNSVTAGAGLVTVSLKDEPARKILDALSGAGLTWTMQGGFVHITKTKPITRPTP